MFDRSTIPHELKGSINGDTLEMTEGAIHDVAAAAKFLREQKFLTHVHIADAVDVAEFEGQPGTHELANALLRAASKNLVDAGIAHSPQTVQRLNDLCDGNRRAAESLMGDLQNITSRHSTIKWDEVAQRLPAVVAVATASGPSRSRHAIGVSAMLDILAQIDAHAGQHDVPTDAAYYVQQLASRATPKALVDASSCAAAPDRAAQAASASFAK